MSAVASREGWYVYGVVPASAQAPAAAAVDPRFPVELRATGGLAALVSRVRPDELAPDDERSVERVLAHEAVLEAALDAGTTVVPFRFGTVVAGTDDVAALLETRGDALHEALARLEGRVELGVRASVDAASLRAAVGADDEEARRLEAELAQAGPGAAHLRGKQLERRLARLASAERARLGEELHARLTAAATAARANPLRADGDGSDPVLNGAYLLSRGEEETFRAAAEALAAAHAPLGLRVSVTGPWPPYNFVEDGDERD